MFSHQNSRLLVKYSNEKDLISDLKKGNEFAYIYLVDHYNRRLYAYALSLSSDSEQAQDIIQNVFLRIWERRQHMEITTSLLSYLFRSVYNEFLNLNKKKTNTQLIEQKYFESLERITQNYSEASLEKALERVNNEIQKAVSKMQGGIYFKSKGWLNKYRNIKLFKCFSKNC